MDQEIGVRIIKRIEQEYGYDYIKCHICDEKKKSMMSHLRVVHGINVKEFKKEHPNFIFISDYSNEKSRVSKKEWYKTHENPMKGKKISIESKKRMSLAKKGKPGRKHTEEEKTKIGKSHIGSKCKDETKEKISKANTGKIKSYDVRSRTSETLQKMHQDHPELAKLISEKISGENNYFYGKHHSEETKQKLREKSKQNWEDQNSIFNSEEYRQNLSEGHLRTWREIKQDKERCAKISEEQSIRSTEMILSGKILSYGSKKHKKGFYHNNKNNIDIYYVSSWEESFMRLCDDIGEINKFDKVRFFIKYIDSFGQQRRYIPDFFINEKIIIEIKPKLMLNRFNNQNKFSACMSYCLENDLRFIIITEDELNKESIIKLISD